MQVTAEYLSKINHALEKVAEHRCVELPTLTVLPVLIKWYGRPPETRYEIHDNEIVAVIRWLGKRSAFGSALWRQLRCRNRKVFGVLLDPRDWENGHPATDFKASRRRYLRRRRRA